MERERIRQDLLTITKSINTKKTEKIIEEISGVVQNWDRYEDEVEVDEGCDFGDFC